MTLEAIASIGTRGIEADAGIARSAGAFLRESMTQPPPDRTFDSLVAEIQNLNTRMIAGQQATAGLALGNTEGLETVMLNFERTRLQFEVLMSVRNRVLEAYQEVVRMQV